MRGMDDALFARTVGNDICAALQEILVNVVLLG